MQIVIPMSGFGERFKKVGYKVPKPLIEIEGKPIIAHVIDMFPGETNFVFICNQDHLDQAEYKMREILQQYCPRGKIIGIPAHKLGPVYAVLQAKEYIDLQEPTIINYCDFNCYWNWMDFKSFVATTKCDGAIPVYRGFHPHTLGSTNYAYIREENGNVLDIQEKQPYTSNRMNEFASSGTYYYSSGQVALHALEDCVAQNLNLNGEFYVSLTYKSMLQQHKNIKLYELQHFMQWGTPEDVAEYNMWSHIFKRLAQKDQRQVQQKDQLQDQLQDQQKNQHKKLGGSIVIPMAGLGQRFANEGYEITKSLIPVSGKPMILQAVDFLYQADYYDFVIRTDMVGQDHVSTLLANHYNNCIITTINSVTDGQATTAKIGLDALSSHNAMPVTFSACDNGVLFDVEKLQELFDNTAVDVIVWGVRRYFPAQRNPQHYGWIKTEKDNKIEKISVKIPLKNPAEDPVVIGTFSFRNAKVFYEAYERMRHREGKVNNEYYLDECINDVIALGYNCKLFECDAFISWGTPNELKTFEYWQSCFHKWKSHDYSLDLDCRVNKEDIAQLENKYQELHPSLDNGCLKIAK